MKEVAEAIAAIFEFFSLLLRRKTTADNIKQIIALFDQMKYIITETSVERVIILKLENGGGVIKPGVSLYSSVVYEDFEKEKFDSIKDRFQRVSLDSDALQMLSQAIDKKSIAVDVNMLKPNTLLSGTWAQQGVDYAEYYHLQSTKKCVFFCSIETTNKTNHFQTNAERSIINLSIDKIRQLLSGKRVKESL